MELGSTMHTMRSSLATASPYSAPTTSTTTCECLTLFVRHQRHALRLWPIFFLAVNGNHVPEFKMNSLISREYETTPLQAGVSLSRRLCSRPCPFQGKMSVRLLSSSDCVSLLFAGHIPGCTVHVPAGSAVVGQRRAQATLHNVGVILQLDALSATSLQMPLKTCNHRPVRVG
jgi:hypothetical protein